MAFFNNNTRMTSRHVDKMMADRRRVEAQHNDLLNYANQSSLQAQANRTDFLVASKRRANARAQCAAENMLESRFAKPEAEARNAARRAAQDQNIALALEAERREAERREREIQRICDSSEELRELESKLKIAYMNKERAVQQTQKEMLSQAEAKREAAMNDQMEYDRQASLVAAANHEKVRRADAIAAKEMIQKQMLQRISTQAESAAEAEADRMKVDAIMKKIQEEDAAEAARRAAHITATREVIRGSIEERKATLAARAAEEAAEEERVAAYARHRAAREAGIKASLDEKKRREEAAFEAVEAEIKRKRAEEEELAALRDDLWTEEMHLAKMEKERAKVAAIEAAKAEMMASNESQLKLKAKLEAEATAQEETYNEYLRQTYAAQEAAEAQAAAEAAERMQAYKQAIVDQNLTKQELYMQELEAEKAAAAAIKEEEEFKKRVVEEAKARLIATHEAKVAGYLPKGVVRNNIFPETNE